MRRFGVIIAVLGLLAPVLGSAAFDPARMRDDGALGGFSGWLSRSGIRAIDVDGDGTEEIVVANDRSWSLLVHEPGGGWWQAIHVETENPGDAWANLLVGDADGDSAREVLLMRGGSLTGALDVFDLRTGVLERSIAWTSGPPSLGDVDPAPGEELVACGTWGVEVFNVATGLLWSIANGAAGATAVGQVDADPTPEIVTAGNFFGDAMVIDVATRSLQWQMTVDLNWPSTADLDGDGMLEALVGTRSGATSPHDYFSFPGDIHAFSVAAVDPACGFRATSVEVTASDAYVTLNQP